MRQRSDKWVCVCDVRGRLSISESQREKRRLVRRERNEGNEPWETGWRSMIPLSYRGRYDAVWERAREHTSLSPLTSQISHHAPLSSPSLLDLLIAFVMRGCFWKRESVSEIQSERAKQSPSVCFSLYCWTSPQINIGSQPLALYCLWCLTQFMTSQHICDYTLDVIDWKDHGRNLKWTL